MSEDRERAQRRENAGPEGTIRLLPLTVAIITLVIVLSGVFYIFFSGPLANSRGGDQHSPADLPGPAAPGAAVEGKALFAANCTACHQATGLGLPGVIPPLDGSEWVRGDTRVLANILLHGIDGDITVKGTPYQGSMPSFQHLNDADLAGLASYIRSAWSNKADPVPAELFAQERKAGNRTTPFEGGAALDALRKP